MQQPAQPIFRECAFGTMLNDILQSRDKYASNKITVICTVYVVFATTRRQTAQYKLPLCR